MKNIIRLRIIALLLLAVVTFSHGEGVGPGKEVQATLGSFNIMPLYAYKKANEQIAFNFTKTRAAGGTTTLNIKLYSPTGVLWSDQSFLETDPLNTSISGVITSANSTEVGIWTFVITRGGLNPGGPMSYTSDVNVKTSTGSNMPGWVYTTKLNIQHSSTKMPEFSVYSVNQQGYEYRSTFYGLTPIGIEFVANSFGNILTGTSGPCTSAYKSASLTDTRYASGNNCGGSSKIFFNEIAEDLPASAQRWNVVTSSTVTEWLNPEIAVETVTVLSFTPGTTAGSAAGSFGFNVANYVGNATLSIDVNNNGLYTDAIDRSISTGVQEGSNTVAFDGKDRAGNNIPCTSTLKAKLTLDRPGEIHFVLNDAEGLDGIRITRLNGVSQNSVINWDDSNVLLPKATVTPLPVGIDVNSSFNATTHGWAIAPAGSTNQSWGDNVNIDNWAFVPGAVNQEITVTSLCPVPDLTPTTDIDGFSFPNAGDSKDFIVNLYEINNITTSGQIRFRIAKLSAFTITFPTVNGTSNVFGGTLNENANWDFTENASFITVTAKTGIVIAAGGQAKIGFNITRKASIAAGTGQNITPTIISGSGGEDNLANNQVVTTVTAN